MWTCAFHVIHYRKMECTWHLYTYLPLFSLQVQVSIGASKSFMKKKEKMVSPVIKVLIKASLLLLANFKAKNDKIVWRFGHRNIVLFHPWLFSFSQMNIFDLAKGVVVSQLNGNIEKCEYVCSNKRVCRFDQCFLMKLCKVMPFSLELKESMYGCQVLSWLVI